MSSKTIKAEELAELSDSDILKLRFKNIALNISETEIQDYINQLYSELEAKGLTFRPQIFFGDEWFSPEGMNAIQNILITDRVSGGGGLLPYRSRGGRKPMINKNRVAKTIYGAPREFYKSLYSKRVDIF